MNELLTSLMDALLLLCLPSLLPLIVYAIWEIHRTSDQARQTRITQRTRYTLLWLAVASSSLPTATLISIYGMRSLSSAIAAWLWSAQLIGLLMAGSLGLGLLSPLIGALGSLRIYRHPAFLAMRRQGGWVATQDVRSGTALRTIYELKPANPDWPLSPLIPVPRVSSMAD